MALTLSGFTATDNPALIAAWLDRARERYTRLEQAFLPLQRAVDQVAPNWEQMSRDLLAVRAAVQECRPLLDREQSRSHPVPRALLSQMRPCAFRLALASDAQAKVWHCLLQDDTPRRRQKVLRACETLCDAGQQAISEFRRGIANAEFLTREKDDDQSDGARQPRTAGAIQPRTVGRPHGSVGRDGPGITTRLPGAFGHD